MILKKIYASKIKNTSNFNNQIHNKHKQPNCYNIFEDKINNSSSFTSLKTKSKKQPILIIFIASLVISIFLFCQFASFSPLYANSLKRLIPKENIDTVAESAIICDLNSDKVFWEKNADIPMYPASITKIMTAIITLEDVKDLSKVVSISKNAAGRNYSSVYLKKGDKITLEDLLKLALITSNNNATIALAEYISGDVNNFVKLMNEKAKEIGVLNTNFENTNGLDDASPGHKTTARDLVKIAKYCMKNQKFRELVSTKETKIFINKKEIKIQNTNVLLENNFIKGIKTGYTSNAGFCLITYSIKNDLELLCVVLNSSSCGRDYDSLRLINWVYENFKYKKIVDSGRYFVKVSLKNDSSNVNLFLYPQNDVNSFVNIADDAIYYNYCIDDIGLPLYPNKKYGTLYIYINEEKIDEINLISHEI
jgi:D-alanyl-D-alanine carboxypeptidase (penicillin-binding protein 5/6)